MATKKSKGGVNRSQFIRDRPGKSVAEVLDEAKKAGVKLQAGLVYAVRSADKKGKGGAKAAKIAKATKSSASTGLAGMDQAIRAIVREELRALLSKV